MSPGLGVMKAQFFMMAKYCDELVTVTVGKQPNGTPITVQEPRYQLNLVVDGSKTAAEWIATICSVMQANLFYYRGQSLVGHRQTENTDCSVQYVKHGEGFVYCTRNLLQTNPECVRSPVP